MTFDLAAMRQNRDAGTPGPWWTDGKYDGRELGCAVIAAKTDAGLLPGNPTRGIVAWASAALNANARLCEANARRIASVPAMEDHIESREAEIARLTAHIERQAALLAEAREALRFYANPNNWDEDGICWFGKVSAPVWSEHDFDLVTGDPDGGARARATLAKLGDA